MIGSALQTLPSQFVSLLSKSHTKILLSLMPAFADCPHQAVPRQCLIVTELVVGMLVGVTAFVLAAWLCSMWTEKRHAYTIGNNNYYDIILFISTEQAMLEWMENKQCLNEWRTHYLIEKHDKSSNYVNFQSSSSKLWAVACPKNHSYAY